MSDSSSSLLPPSSSIPSSSSSTSSDNNNNVRHRGPLGSRPVVINGTLKWVNAKLTDEQIQSLAASDTLLSSTTTNTSFLSSSSSTSSSLLQNYILYPLQAIWSIIKGSPLKFSFLFTILIGIQFIPDLRLRGGVLGVAISIGGILYMCIAAKLRGYNTRPGELSPYSIFNPRGERMMGQLTSEHFERELRGGAAATLPTENQRQPQQLGEPFRGGGHILGGRRTNNENTPPPNHQNQYQNHDQGNNAQDDDTDK